MDIWSQGIQLVSPLVWLYIYLYHLSLKIYIFTLFYYYYFVLFSVNLFIFSSHFLLCSLQYINLDIYHLFFLSFHIISAITRGSLYSHTLIYIFIIVKDTHAVSTMRWQGIILSPIYSSLVVSLSYGYIFNQMSPPMFAIISIIISK